MRSQLLSCRPSTCYSLATDTQSSWPRLDSICVSARPHAVYISWSNQSQLLHVCLRVRRSSLALSAPHGSFRHRYYGSCGVARAGHALLLSPGPHSRQYRLIRFASLCTSCKCRYQHDRASARCSDLRSAYSPRRLRALQCVVATACAVSIRPGRSSSALKGCVASEQHLDPQSPVTRKRHVADASCGRSGKTSILSVVLDDINPNSTVYNEPTRIPWTKRFECVSQRRPLSSPSHRE